jgi:hypothetical protein
LEHGEFLDIIKQDPPVALQRPGVMWSKKVAFAIRNKFVITRGGGAEGTMEGCDKDLQSLVTIHPLVLEIECLQTNLTPRLG